MTNHYSAHGKKSCRRTGIDNPMGFLVTTTNRHWWLHYEYGGSNIDVRIDKNNISLDSALAQATWAIVRSLDKVDGLMSGPKPYEDL